MPIYFADPVALVKQHVPVFSQKQSIVKIRPLIPKPAISANRVWLSTETARTIFMSWMPPQITQ